MTTNPIKSLTMTQGVLFPADGPKTPAERREAVRAAVAAYLSKPRIARKVAFRMRRGGCR